MSGHTYEQAIYEKYRAVWSEAEELLSVSQLLPRTAARCGDKVALTAPNRDVSYTQWWQYVCSVAAKLKAAGVKKGDRVMLYLSNSPEFYGAYFAVWHLGAIVVPLNVYLHEKEMAGIIEDATPRLIVTTQEMAKKLPAVAPELVFALKEVWWNESELAQASEKPALFKADDTAVILYTSGTTGVPKGVMLSSRNVLTNALQVLARFSSIAKPDDNERFFSVLPLFHVFAQNTCMWLPVLLGATVIIVPRIDRRAILDGLAQEPTMFFGFPALYGLLVLMKTAPLDQVRLFISGADALPDKIRAAFALVYGRKICSGYGLTEASPVIAVDGVNEDAPTNMVGQPLMGVTCQIRDENGEALATGEIGTLWVKGDNVMKGYYKAKKQTSAVLVDGWLNTGDMACFDHDGDLAICGRSKDLIISKGFNIYPQEVENTLLKHPAVIKAAVMGKEEKSVGQIPVAFVAIRPGATVDESQISSFCKQNLAPYKVPRSITCLQDLPMTATGKIDKKQLLQ